MNSTIKDADNVGMKFAKIGVKTYPMTIMSAVVEFQAQVKDGMILIPDQYKGSFNPAKDVQVILIQKSGLPIETESSEANFLQALLENPVTVENFVPLTRDQIYDR
jgi:hypothetical protein